MQEAGLSARSFAPPEQPAQPPSTAVSGEGCASPFTRLPSIGLGGLVSLNSQRRHIFLYQLFALLLVFLDGIYAARHTAPCNKSTS